MPAPAVTPSDRPPRVDPPPSAPSGDDLVGAGQPWARHRPVSISVLVPRGTWPPTRSRLPSAQTNAGDQPRRLEQPLHASGAAAPEASIGPKPARRQPNVSPRSPGSPLAVKPELHPDRCRIPPAGSCGAPFAIALASRPAPLFDARPCQRLGRVCQSVQSFGLVEPGDLTPSPGLSNSHLGDGLRASECSIAGLPRFRPGWSIGRTVGLGAAADRGWCLLER
jgi:hypothetical protein